MSDWSGPVQHKKPNCQFGPEKLLLGQSLLPALSHFLRPLSSVINFGPPKEIRQILEIYCFNKITQYFMLVLQCWCGSDDVAVMM